MTAFDKITIAHANHQVTQSHASRDFLAAQMIRYADHISALIKHSRPDQDGWPCDRSLEMVGEFHSAFGHPQPAQVNISDQALNLLRLELLEEELGELWSALKAGDVVETADALGDIEYVLNGAWKAFGLAQYKQLVMEEIHRSNMSKLGEDGKPIYREDGKILKGPNYSPPNIAKLLEVSND
mgnify:FL=1